MKVVDGLDVPKHDLVLRSTRIIIDGKEIQNYAMLLFKTWKQFRVHSAVLTGKVSRMWKSEGKGRLNMMWVLDLFSHNMKKMKHDVPFMVTNIYSKFGHLLVSAAWFMRVMSALTPGPPIVCRGKFLCWLFFINFDFKKTEL